MLIILCQLLPTYSFRLSNQLCNPLKKSYLKVLHLKSTVIPGVGKEGCKLPSPSGINTKSNSLQALTFFGSYGIIFTVAYMLITLFDYLNIQFPILNNWISSFSFLGPLFITFGILHFTLKKEFLNIMPAQGAWGFW